MEVQRQIDRADSQLALYALDLKRVVDLERRKSRELAEANARLKSLDCLKTDFLTFISHELRTPLNGISMIDLFDPQGDPGEQAEVVDVVRKGYEHLQEFILKGLEYFQWLAEERTESSTIVDLACVVKTAVDVVPGLAAPGVHLEIAPSPGPCTVLANEAHLVEVFKILLANALKFSTGDKFVRVEVSRTGEQVTLAVTDRGIGLRPEFVREVFRPFTIADVRHHTVGTGLNLALANLIVKAYRGTIRAESEGVGKGARFIIDLPAVSSSEPTSVGQSNLETMRSSSG